MESWQQKIKDTVRDMDDGQLFADDCERLLMKQFLQPALHYEKQKSVKIISAKEPQTFKAPAGFEFEAGAMYPYVEFRYAIEGNYLHKDLAFNREFLSLHQLSFLTEETNVYLVLRYNQQPGALSDTGFLEEANEAGKVARQVIEERLTQFNLHVEEVNSTLTLFIQQTLVRERAARMELQAKLEALNPF